MKDLTSSEKVTVLLAALQERYEALRSIRARVEGIGLWSLGLLLAGAAWIVQSDAVIGRYEKVLYIAGILVGICVLRCYYLSDLAKGFKGQQKVTVRLEKVLGLYEHGTFDDTEEGVYPIAWKKAGMEDGDGRFFKTTYILLYTSAVLLIAVILLAPCW